MSFSIQTTTEPEDAANFIASAVLNKLKAGKRVLLFLTGGSSIAVGLKVAEFLQKYPHQNLTITLTDERYGPADHFNSNFFQLKEKGFALPEAKILPILFDEDRNITTEKFDKVLETELKSAEYKIGLFGVGVDGHTAGILPESPATSAPGFAFSYETPIFSRITITPKVVESLDEAVVFMQGKEKWSVVQDLLEKNIDLNKQPAQILKKVPLLTIFTDYKKL